MTQADRDVREGALAEYAALRSEITTRISAQHQMLALHMTAVSVVFSVALSGGARWPVLLVIPFVSYTSSEILASLFHTVEAIARYIDEELSPKVPGGLGWESWLARHRPESELRKLTHPYYLLFPGVSVVSLAAVTPFVWTGGVSAHRFDVSFCGGFRLAHCSRLCRTVLQSRSQAPCTVLTMRSTLSRATD